MGYKSEVKEPLILTPHDDDRIYVFHPKNNLPVHVVECPGVRFEGFPVCLATAKAKELPKLKFMAKKMNQLWQQLADNGFPVKG